MTKEEFQRSNFINYHVELGKQIVWLNGMLTVARRGLTNFRHDKGASFRNAVECLLLMGTDGYLTGDQRSTLIPMIKLAREKPEVLRGISSVLRQFIRDVSKLLIAREAG